MPNVSREILGVFWLNNNRRLIYWFDGIERYDTIYDLRCSLDRARNVRKYWIVPRQIPGPAAKDGINWLLDVLKESARAGCDLVTIRKIMRSNQLPEQLLYNVVLAGIDYSPPSHLPYPLPDEVMDNG